ncbi:MAG: hypothetical protein IH914_10665 [candidate division Zixibacteria bacterium]|nr:hypothetical protein [candidate division Zixibacteria bacterium]
MQTLKLIAVTFFAVALSGCSNAPNDTNPPATVPEPTSVPYSNIPPIDTPELYRATGGVALNEDPVPLLQAVLDAGFDLRRAWYPRGGICAAVFVDELIIQLDSPNAEIANLGFSRDFTGTSGGCAIAWAQYDFVRSGVSGNFQEE